MSKAIRELERKKREEERLRLMRKYYEKPKAPPYAPPLLSKGSSNPDGAAWIIAKLEESIKDEAAAAIAYSVLADELDKYGAKGFAAGVRLIAEDERRHMETLKNILRETRGAITFRIVGGKR